MDIIEISQVFLSDFLGLMAEMSPYLLLGFFFAGLLHAFIPQNKIERFFNGNRVKSSVWASLFGIPLPLCSCGVIPTGAALYKNGASKGGTISFLISTPQTGVDSMLATFSLMGLPFAIVRPLAALITGITGGIITSSITKTESTNKLSEPSERRYSSFNEKIKDALRYGFVEFIQDISKWLLIGLVLAAIISALIPNDFFELLNMPPLLQMLMILVVSIPLYICATGSIPLATILILKGISPGAAFVLLMAGPATNAATITVIARTLGKKSLFTYLGTIITGALLFGLLIDYALPTEWFTQFASQHIGHHHEYVSNWWQYSSAVILGLLIVNGYLQRHRKSTQTNINTVNNNRMKVQTIQVEGMSCNHCKNNVESNLNKLSYINQVEVNLPQKTVRLEGEQIDMEEVKETIHKLGYKVP